MGGKPSGGKPSGGKPSGGKPSGGKPSGGKPSGGSKKPGKTSSTSDSDKKPGKTSDTSGSDKKPGKDSSSGDKKPSKDKLEGEGSSGISSGDSTQDVYNKLHKPGNVDKPSNGGHARGDLSQPGPGSSGSSGTGSKVGGHIKAGGSAVGVVTGDQSGSKSPLNMVDKDRFGNGVIPPSSGVSDQFRHSGEGVNPGER